MKPAADAALTQPDLRGAVTEKILQGRVALVTGAGAGLGRSHALALARAGARVMLNDLGSAADTVKEEIIEAGGEALAFRCSVTDEQAVADMVDATLDAWGQIDILVNNAGILRDRTFAKLTLDDFRQVIEVHLMGSVICTKAVWEPMRKAGYGRVVLTTSSSGLYGNFGQSNYAAAKMGLVGLMHTLALEGARYGIRVNCLAPSAATGMTDGLYPPDVLRRLGPDQVSPAIVALAAEGAPNRAIVLAGGGSFAVAHVTMTRGIYREDPSSAAGEILERFAELSDRMGELIPASGIEQHQAEVARATTQVAGAS